MTKKFILLFLTFTLTINLGQQRKMSLQATGKNDIDFKYLLFLPQDYNESQKTRWPLILFLHGKGERGEDLDLVKIHGIPKIVATEKEFPFIAVSPQCPIDHVWADDFMQQKVLDLLSKIVHNYRVDRNRIYLTGLSMGGYGTWSLATSRPDLFAAAVPICGGGDPSTVSKLKDLPIRVFHGALDKVVLSENSEKMVTALQKAGGNVTYTLYPDANHDSWTETYANPGLYDWLLAQRRTDH
ncbi:MAG: prolyl oligopeptidase family serine peptidase [Candidatus Marinimicrobia bacterium]|jgi:predicted peptidase|nr:prolyl oligopeptidase family serine peptidase [Candidatus Neomarinimicrobiota bacterium]MDP6836737.1 prolyl oligopeptidase family serine peptidase [Candidatus Neomarinimicrobiota bacterium]